MTAPVYPQSPAERTRWIVERRGARNPAEIDRPVDVLIEEERCENGGIARIVTVFLANRECPWTCVMCDLWRHTAPAPPGSIPKQIQHALAEVSGASVLKLYNSGSFFDAGAIPKSDWHAIAELCNRFDRVIVESHPRLLGKDALRFRDLIQPTRLEVAMGLETCHPAALEKLNKRITTADFARAARLLRAGDISVRTFLLVGVPFLAADEQQDWLRHSIEFAFDSGSDVVSLIPTRTGNGALEALAATGEFREPLLRDVEDAHEFGIELKRGLVFADTWEIGRFARCSLCAPARRQRLHRMNLSQRVEPRIKCSCEG